MKLATAIAATAMLAGLSFAHAQSNPDNMATGMKKNAAFCIQTNKGNETDCRFTTMASCEKEAKSKGDGGNCIQNPGKMSKSDLPKGTTMNRANNEKGMKAGTTGSADTGASTAPSKANSGSATATEK